MRTLNKATDRIKTAILLAAGTGNRLRPYTNELPKCLTEVNETAILERLIRSLRFWDFERLIVVVGHLDNCIRKFLNRRAGNIEIEYVHSSKYETTNNIYSLWAARNKICEPFLLLECDLVFDKALLAGMLKPGRIAISRILPWMNGTTVSLDESGKVNRFHIGKQSMEKHTFKTVNMYSFSMPSWQRISQRLEHHIAAGHVNGFYETVFAEMVDERVLSFDAVYFDDQGWYEIDTPDDLREAERLFPRGGRETTAVFTP